MNPLQRLGLLDKVPRNHHESDAAFTRRRRVVAGTGLLGTVLLERSLSQKPGSRAFYGYALAVAGTWVAGGLASGPLHLGREFANPEEPALHLVTEPPYEANPQLRRPVLMPIATGAGAFAGLYACALAARRIPILRRAVSSILAFAEQGDLVPVVATTLVNGLGEEFFFRGALYASVPEPHQVAVTTVAYTLITGASTRNPSLVLAAGGMGALFGLQRRATGGIQAPALTHLTWSALVLRFLPPLFGRDTPG